MYVPKPHGSQRTLLTISNPTSHLQVIEPSFAKIEMNPVVHVHASIEVEEFELVVENSGHKTHDVPSVWPSNALNVPTGHGIRKEAVHQ